MARGAAALGGWRPLFTAIAVAVASVASVQALFRSDLRSAGRPRSASFAAAADLAPAARGGLGAVLKTAAIWVIGVNYAACYFVRMGVEGWIGTYLAEARGVGSVGAFLFFWQCGGVVGTATAGPVAARWRPAAAVAGSAALVLAFAAALAFGGASAATLGGAAFLGGGAVYGTRVLLQLAIRDHVHRGDCGKADAIANALAECGGALAGLPLVRALGDDWAAFPSALAAAAAVLCVAAAALAFLDGARAPPAKPGGKAD